MVQIRWGRAAWFAVGVLALAILPTSVARGDEVIPGLSTPLEAFAEMAPRESYLLTEWARGPRPGAGPLVIDALLSARIDHLQRVSPSFRQAWSALEAAGTPVLIGSSEQVAAVTPAAIRESADWASVTLTWADSAGLLERAAVAVRIQSLRELHDQYGNLPHAFHNVLEDVLIREIQGNLAPAAGL